MKVVSVMAAVVCAWPQLAWSAESASYPFPPGKDAILVKQVCASCHPANLVLDRRFDEADAKKFYRLYVGNPDTDQGRRIVEYLTTVLGEK